MKFGATIINSEQGEYLQASISRKYSSKDESIAQIDKNEEEENDFEDWQAFKFLCKAEIELFVASQTHGLLFINSINHICANLSE